MSNARWLEVSLVVDGELAEAVADVLARFAPNGVVLESTAIRFQDEEDKGQAVGPIRVRAYLEIDQRLEEMRQKLETALHYLSLVRPVPAPTYTPIPEQNWMEAWKQNYRPIAIGRRLLILPSWMDPPDSSRQTIKIDPGMAFGTGAHPSTQLCLELMEEWVEGASPPDLVFDIGCGSGILAMAALRLGGTRALGVDTDPDAIQNARQNAAHNGFGSELVFEQGSVAEVLRGRWGRSSAPLVLVNILAPVILRLLDQGLADLVEPGGALILSGILEEQAETVIQAVHDHGFAPIVQRRQGDWVALLAQRPSGENSSSL